MPEERQCVKKIMNTNSCPVTGIFANFMTEDLTASAVSLFSNLLKSLLKNEKKQLRIRIKLSNIINK